ncbi:hypothetical protein FKP32DRAFT_1568831, partial [Trametes sanguinea]
DGAPEWILEAKDHFVTVSTDRRWVRAVEVWLELERLTVIFPKDARLPTQDRPLQLRQWIQAKRKYSATPSISKVAEFGASCQLWWSTLQPQARGVTSDGHHKRPAPPLPVEEWEGLRKGGPNGLFLVLLALGWWITAARGQRVEYDGAFKVVEDFIWVLENLIIADAAGSERDGSGPGENDKDGNKNIDNPEEAASEEEEPSPNKKRRRTQAQRKSTSRKRSRHV